MFFTAILSCIEECLNCVSYEIPLAYVTTLTTDNRESLQSELLKSESPIPLFITVIVHRNKVLFSEYRLMLMFLSLALTQIHGVPKLISG